MDLTILKKALLEGRIPAAMVDDLIAKLNSSPSIMRPDQEEFRSQ